MNDFLCSNVVRSIVVFAEFSFVTTSKEVTRDHRDKQRKETSRVVTVRVVSKGGWCTAGEIDSYLDENEA